MAKKRSFAPAFARACFSRPTTSLLLRHPPISRRARAAHQHRALGIAQALGLDERPHGLLVVHDRESARPVRAPQAAIDTPRVEDARERLPDIVGGVGLLRERARAADLDHGVLALGELQ